MSKLKPTWFQLVNLDGEIGCIAYNAGQKLFRKWMPNKAVRLSKYLAELGENNIHIATVTPEDYSELPTEAEYYAEEEKEEVKPVSPITSETRISPNKSERAGTINKIVLHNTASSYSSAVSWLTNPNAQASAHLVIGRDGKVCRMVEDNFASWHAGNRTVNHQSIGIEIVATNEEQGMTKEQEAQAIAWVKYFADKYNIKADNIVGHRTIVNTSCPVLIWKTEADLRAWVSKNIAGKKEEEKSEDVKIVNGFYNFDRSVKANLSKDFTTEEVRCKCGCNPQKISVNLITKLQAIRDIVKIPVNITSGYRCEKHNASLPNSSPTSNHVAGKACDIWFDGYSVDAMYNIAKKVGLTVGRYYSSKFIHVSVDSNEQDFIGD